MNHPITGGLLAALLFTSAAATQSICDDNFYPITLTDSTGTAAPTFFENGSLLSQFYSEAVYFRLDPNTPDGLYTWQVTDINIANLLNTDFVVERQITVSRPGGLFTVSHNGVPYAGNLVPVTGVMSPPAGQPQCRFKLWLAQNYQCFCDPNTSTGWVFAPRAPNETNPCSLRSFAKYRIGSGEGVDASGTVFDDVNQNGLRDAGEPGMANQTVSLADGTTTTTTTTDQNGNFTFGNLPCGNYSVELILNPNSGYYATTPTSRQLEVCGCVAIDAGDFGLAMQSLTCQGHTRGFWTNRNGMQIIRSHNLLTHLPGLHVVDMCGHPFATTNECHYRIWMTGANAWNMSYALSAQLVAMHFNVMSGRVSPNCVIRDRHLGTITIGNLIQQAISALMVDGFTPPCDPNRAVQERLKNALDNANNNRNWL